MTRNTARAIERHRLACIPLHNGGWLVGQATRAIHIDELHRVLDGELGDSPATGRPHIGTTLDSAVEDWCNARNLPYERED